MSDTAPTTATGPLPEYLQPLPDAAGQRALDRWAIEQLGILGLTLMETAGAALAQRCAALAPDGRIVVTCGPGNNGGDGFVAARLLRERGRAVEVLLTGDPARYQGDARANLQRLPGPAPVQFTAAALAGAAAVIDAILGTGFSGTPREPVASAIRAINDWRAGGTERVVLACDIASGVDASSGEIRGAAVLADATVTFHAAKPGHWIAPGKRAGGELSVTDIGIPAAGATAPPPPWAGLIDTRVLDTIPRRGAGSTKFSAGNVVICGGSRGLSGAPVMAASAAARAGAGYVTVAVPDRLAEVMAIKLLEVMCRPLPERDGAIGEHAADAAVAALARADALVLGPGLGRTPASQQFARELAARARTPLVLDADGLNAHAAVDDGLELLRQRPAPTVLTPHAGELARLLGVESATIESTRLACVRDAAARSDAVVVLKGDDTLIAAPDGRLAISPGGAPALATAGTGDVLAGVIGTLLAKRLDPFTAACAGVLAHLRAGQRAGALLGDDGVIASDVIAALPWAIARDRVASVDGELAVERG